MMEQDTTCDRAGTSRQPRGCTAEWSSATAINDAHRCCRLRWRQIL